MIFRWRGTVDTAWEKGTNWVNEAGNQYLIGVYPGVNNDGVDDAFLDAAVTNALAGSDESAKAIRSFRVSADYDKACGSSGTYLQLDVADVILEATNATAVYLMGDTATACTILDGTVLLKGTIGTLTCLKGTITLDAATTISTVMNVGYTTSQVDDVILTIPNVTALCTTINANGGTVACSEPITTLNVNGAEWTQATGDITTLTVTSGTFFWTNGNITTAHLYGGTLDGSAGSNPRRLATAYTYPTALIDLDNGQDNILVTSYVRRFGGTVTVGSGYDMAPYRNETYAGAADAVQGIFPQTLNTGGTAAATSTVVYVGPQDRLLIYATTGNMAAGASIIVHAEEDDVGVASWVDEAGKSETFADTDDNQTRLIEIGGWELTRGTPYVHVIATNSAAFDGTVSVVMVKIAY